jgi:hypothetical protein
MQNSTDRAYYLRDTWPRRVADALGALMLLVIAGAALGVTIICLLQSVMLMQADALAWPLMGYLVCSVLGGVFVVQLARGFIHLAGHALSTTPAAPVVLPTGAVAVGAYARESA